MYLGQSDQELLDSFFNYVLEINDNDEIRYAKYSKGTAKSF